MEFKLPIQYIEHHTLSDTIRDDLEINTCYKNILGDSKLLGQWTNYYTSSKTFLENTQQVIKNIDINPINNEEMLEATYSPG